MAKKNGLDHVSEEQEAVDKHVIKPEAELREDVDALARRWSKSKLRADLLIRDQIAHNERTKAIIEAYRKADKVLDHE